MQTFVRDLLADEHLIVLYYRQGFEDNESSRLEREAVIQSFYQSFVNGGLAAGQRKAQNWLNLLGASEVAQGRSTPGSTSENSILDKPTDYTAPPIILKMNVEPSYFILARTICLCPWLTTNIS